MPTLGNLMALKLELTGKLTRKPIRKMALGLRWSSRTMVAPGSLAQPKATGRSHLGQGPSSPLHHSKIPKTTTIVPSE